MTKTVTAVVTKTAHLRVNDRIALLQVLPDEGGISTARIIADLRKRLGVSMKEFESLPGYQVGAGGRIQWEGNDEKPKSMSFGAFEQELIVATLRKLNDKEKVTPELVPVWDAFIGTDGDGKVSTGE